MKIYTLRSPGSLCFKNAFFLLKSRILEILACEQPDVIYQRVAFSGTGIAAKHCRESKCKLVWHIASERDLMPYPYKDGRWRAVGCIESKYRDYGIRNADAIIGQATYQDTLLRERYGRGCDLIVGNFQPLPSEQVAKDRPITVVWVANVKPLKRPELFIRLAGMLRHRRGARFLMVGRAAAGRYQKRLDRAIAGLPNLTYVGEKAVDEVNRTLAGAHVLVNTSLYEGFPNTFIQAWLRHVPVASLDVDPDDLLKTERLGFHSRSLDGLARDTEQLIDDRDLRESMGKRAYAYARRHHAMGPNLTRIVSLIAHTQ